MLLWVMSDRAIPRSFRFMEGFGVHTFRFVNVDGDSCDVKFHWKPKLGLQSVVWNEAVKINGADPDFHRRDLWDAIQQGDPPEWELGIQVFDDDFADQFPFDVLDATKLIPEEEVPVRPIGRLVLDRVVDNFFAETEQVAFCTQNIVPGHRLHERPVAAGPQLLLSRHAAEAARQPELHAPAGERAEVPFATLQQDGHMATINPVGRVNYEPNSWSGDERGPREDPVNGFTSVATSEVGGKRRVRPASFADHYSQARQFYLSQTPVEQTHIVDAFVFELSKVTIPDIRARMVANLRNVDEEFAARGRRTRAEPRPSPRRAGPRPIDDLPVSRPLSILANPPDTFRGRKVGALVTDGADAKVLAALSKALLGEGASLEIVAPTIGGVELSDGTWLTADQKIGGGPSVLYDAVVVIASGAGTDQLRGAVGAREFVADAFAHDKFIGHTEAAAPLLDAVGVPARRGRRGAGRPECGDELRRQVRGCATGPDPTRSPAEPPSSRRNVVDEPVRREWHGP